MIASLSERVAAFERRCLIRILRRAEGVVTQAARLAGRNRTEFYRVLARHGLEPDSFRNPRPPETAPPPSLYLHLRGARR